MVNSKTVIGSAIFKTINFPSKPDISCLTDKSNKAASQRNSKKLDLCLNRSLN